MTVVTPIAAQIFEPHATSLIWVGTYVSFTDVTELDVTVASHGEADPTVPPTTQRSSEAQASDKAELSKDATFDHDFPKLSLRTMRQPVGGFASPTHLRPTQFSDVSADHVAVERPARVVHVVPPSVVTSTTIAFEGSWKLAMHSRADVHASDVTESSEGTPTSPTGTHDAPPSSVTRKRSLAWDESMIAHVSAR